MKRRYSNLSLYRLIATILVLQFHIFFIIYAKNIVASVYLSKFLQGLTALSGFLYSQKVIDHVGKFYLIRIKKIILPAILVLLVIGLWNLLAMFVLNNYDYLSLFVGHRAFNNSLLISPGNFYYIPFILGCYLITPLLRKWKWSGLIIVPLVMFLETFIPIRCNVDPLFIVSCYLIGFYVGYFGYSRYVNKYTKSDIIRLIVWAILFAAFIYISHSFIDGSFKVKKYIHVYRNIFLSLFGVSSLFLFAMIFKFINAYKDIPLLKLTDDFTYIIYLYNQAMMVGATDVSSFVSTYAGKTIMVYLFVLSLSLLTYYIYKLLDKRIKKLKFLS